MNLGSDSFLCILLWYPFLTFSSAFQIRLEAELSKENRVIDSLKILLYSVFFHTEL